MELSALVVLGCRLEPGGRLSRAAERRVSVAARAFRHCRAPRIVASGGRRWFGVAEAEAMAGAISAEAMAAALIAAGVPEERIALEWLSASTAENALYSAELVARGAAVGVVTCDWHMPRALACFRRVGLEPQAFPARSPAVSRARRFRRGVRERLSLWLDRAATWGA